MRVFNRALLGCLVAGMATSASAFDLTLQESGIVFEGVSGLTVDAVGNITVTGATINSTTIPGLPVVPDDGFTCGADTEKQDLRDANGNLGSDGTNETCVGVGGGVDDPSVYCDTGLNFDTTLQLCVMPDVIAPEVKSISASPDQLGPNETTSIITFTFDENISSINTSKLSVTNGSLSTPAKVNNNAKKWQATFTRNGTTTTQARITLARGSFFDMAENSNNDVEVFSLTLKGNEPACDLRYSKANVRSENAIFEWPSGTSQTPMFLTRDDVHSYPFTTGTNPKFNGQLGFVPFSNTATVEKDIWISECPGGAPVNGAPYGGVCEKKAKQTTLFWEQGSSTSWRCSLETNTNYFLNVRNHPGSCEYSSGCSAKVQHLITGSAN